MGDAAVQRYIGGLGGIGNSGVGSTSSYTPKALSKEITPEKKVKTFKDVKGCDDAKQELEEVVEYLKNPGKFTGLGGKLPKGILLTGEPGTGKTLLANAIAGEAGVPFFYRAGSEFEEMFVGVGARSLKEPSLLPARIPNLLLNGSSGIAVGMATNIPPHNLGELVDALSMLIHNPEATLQELLEYMPGPDFPTGGIIMGNLG